MDSEPYKVPSKWHRWTLARFYCGIKSTRHALKVVHGRMVNTFCTHTPV